MPAPHSYAYDVIIVGAGGAGLRAAIEAAKGGVSVGLICKSLLGKAHTVMAEGGMAAALANVDDRDSWRVHFADTMRGGQYLNNWRMAELHAKEAPDRVRELEGWGAVWDRTADGRILWDVDTIRQYDTVNGVPGRGGSIDGPGPAIAGGTVVFNSGYHTAGGVPGNVLLAFTVDGR